MKTLTFISLLAVLLAPSACAKRERTVKIAVAAPLTGDLGSEGQGLLRAVTLAVEQANASKRFPYLIETLPVDDRADPSEAVHVANLIISDPTIVAVVGHYNSDCAMRAARVYAEAPVAMITPSATNPEVTLQQLKPDWPGPKTVFRLCPTDDFEAAYAASFAGRRLGRPRMAVVSDSTPYGAGLAAEFARTYALLGGKIVCEEGIAVGQKDFRPLLARIKPLKAQGIFFGGLYTEAGLLVKQMRQNGMEKTLFLSGDAVKTPGFFDVAADAAGGAYLAMVGIPVELLPSARTFMDDYRRRFPGGDEGIRPFDHFGYAAAQIVFDALDKTGPDERFDRAKLIETIRRTPHRGVLGATTFDAKGDAVDKIVTMTRANAGDRTFPAVR